MKKAKVDIFRASQFTQGHPGRPDTPEDKVRFANALAQFVLAGFPQKGFGRVYEDLRDVFGHIAHYDVHGFYASWFADSAARLQWCKHVLEYVPVGPEDSSVDVERALQGWLRGSGIVEGLEKEVAEGTEKAERAELARLKAKYEPTPWGGP